MPRANERNELDEQSLAPVPAGAVADPPAAPIETLLAAALGAMRTDLAGGDDADFHPARAKRLLDARPLILLGIADGGELRLWAMEPGLEDGRDGVLSAEAHALTDDDGSARVFSRATWTLKTALLHDVEDRAQWLERERHGEFFAERGRGTEPAARSGD